MLSLSLSPPLLNKNVYFVDNFRCNFEYALKKQLRSAHRCNVIVEPYESCNVLLYNHNRLRTEIIEVASRLQ